MRHGQNRREAKTTEVAGAAAEFAADRKTTKYTVICYHTALCLWSLKLWVQ